MRTDDDVVNPVLVERTIRDCVTRIAAGVRDVTEREKEARRARRAYDEAVARAYLAYDGPAHAKRYYAELQTLELRERMDVARVAFNHAQRTARATQQELSAWQSLGAGIRVFYNAMTGEGNY